MSVTPWMFQAAAETRPREQLERQTMERLRSTLALASANPTYRARLGGAEATDIGSPEDWARLPFLTKEELRDAYPWTLTCAGRGNVMRVQMSSGTTGNPILNPYTRGDVAQWTEVMARCLAAAGVTSGDVIQITPSFGLFTGGFGFHYGAERIGAMVVPIGAGRTGLQLKLMKELGASVLAAIATYPLRLIEVAREERFDLSSLRLRVAILGSEMWSDDLRALIERELGLESFDIIGMTETGGPGLGIDCRAHDGIHVWEDHYYCEIVDPATGAPRADGAEGELVISTLTREGLPLIRYRTHDITRVVSREPCACGRTHLRLDRFRGRTDDMVIFRGVNFYPRQVESLIVGRPGVGHEYQIVLERAPGGGGDRMTLLVEVRPDFDQAELAAMARDLRDFVSLAPEIRTMREGEIPRAPGKAVRVVDRRSGVSTLAPLFAPRHVAVLGASRNPAKLGHVLLKNVLGGGYKGEVSVVNPGGEPILGRPALRDPEALPAGVDLALVSVPPAAVLPAIGGLAARGVRVAVILTSGFGEVDERGRAEQAALLAAARERGLRLVGPNCMGVYSAPAELNGTYFWDLPRLPGGIAVVSQSGAYGGLIMRHLGGLGLGVSRFLSIGNQADVTIADALEYLADDPETTLVACFIESVRDGRAFVEAARRVSAAKPLVALKGGRTEAGRRAAGSHTGSLAGSAEVYQAAFRGAGVVQCADTDEFFDAIQALATVTLRPRTPSLAIVTVSGGPSVMAADTAESLGLEVPPMSDGARAALRGLLPSFAALGNPVDLTPQVDPQAIPEAMKCIVREYKVSGVLAVNVGLDIQEFADGLVSAAGGAGKPLLACSVDAPGVVARFRAAGVPVYPTPERGVRAFRALWLASRRSGPPAASVRPVLRVEIESILDSAHGPVPYDVARELLTAYGLRFCVEALAGTEPEALAAAERLGFPVVVKTARADVLHRTEAGGVITGLRDAAALGEAYRTVTRRVRHPVVLVQQQMPPGSEILVGGRRDETFGALVAVATGGFLAEAIRDAALALAPLGLDEARELVPLGLRGRLMAGYRGLPGWEPEPVARALVAVGRVLADHPRVREIDVNPLIARNADAVAVDALVMLD